MATPTLEELFTQVSVPEAMDGYVLPELRTERDGVTLPVTDWLVGGAFRALAWVGARLFSEVRRLSGGLAAATHGEYVFGFSDPPAGLDGVTSWASVRARDFYGLKPIEASHTKRTLRFLNGSNASYGPLPAGTVIVEFVDTRARYVNDSAFTIAAGPGVTTAATFRSESAVNSAKGLTYLDPSGATIRLVTASYPGVSVTNPAPTFTPVTLVGSGLGTVTPSGTPGSGYTSSSWAVRINTSGQVGVATWSYRIQASGIDTGWVAAGTATSVTPSGTGITVTLANHASANPSFIIGATYFFSTPGTDVTVRGRDAESPRELGRRCQGIMPLLDWARDGAGNFIAPTTPPEDAFVAMTLTAFPEQVKIAYVRVGSVNDEVVIKVAGQGSTLSAGTIATVQAFWNMMAGLTNYPVVSSPSTQAIELAGATVRVRQAQLASVQAAIQNAIAAYLGGVDPRAPLSIAGLVRREYLIALITNTPGVTGFSDDTFTIEGHAGAAATDYQLLADTMATWGQQVASDAGWTWETE